MANSGVKVLGFWASPYSLRVEWALKLKGVEYEYIEEDIDNKSTQLLEHNPVYKKVPVLVHDNNAIVESCLILEYIDETWNENSPSLMPQDPYERSMVRFWAQFVEEEKIFRNACMAWIAEGNLKKTAIESTQEAFDKIEEILKAKSKFFGGQNIGYLDLVLGWIPQWIPIWEQMGKMEIINQTRFPAITSWMNNLLSHPVIKDTFPSREKMIVYFQELSLREEVIAFVRKETILLDQNRSTV